MGVLFLATSVSAEASAVAPLAAWRWHSRILLVFAPSGASPDLHEQRRYFAASSAGEAERDLVTIEVVGGHADQGADAALLRAHNRIPASQFAVVLIGKDGGEKFRTVHPASADAVFGIIDRMPMRRQERASR